MSMAAGEYVSVSSQADTEQADLAREKAELATQPGFERQELADIYTSRGLEPELALTVADQLMASDALGTHARDELGISDISTARPLQAAFTSAATFSAGAIMPLAGVTAASAQQLIPLVVAVSLLFLVLLVALDATASGATVMRFITRVSFSGPLAMALMSGAGRLSP